MLIGDVEVPSTAQYDVASHFNLATSESAIGYIGFKSSLRVTRMLFDVPDGQHWDASFWPNSTVENLCSRSLNMKTKNFKNYILISAIVNYRN